MRAPIFALAVLLLAAPAQAAMVWAETTAHGMPQTLWTKGANLNEVNAAARAFAGQPIHILESCRTPGWYAYVGADDQTQRGVSCGFETREGAIYRARQACELEGGRCDLERLGFDDGKALGNPPSEPELPTHLTGTTASGYVVSPTGPVDVQ